MAPRRHHFEPLPTTSFQPSHLHNVSTIDSPPSLTYSEFSEESEHKFVNAMDSVSVDDPGSYADASMVMQQVLTKLDAVTEHLRDKGETEAANTIAQRTTEIVIKFNDATATWDYQRFQMPPSEPNPGPGLANTGTASQPRPAIATTGSWASVAAKAVNGKKNPIIKYQPSDTVVKRYQEPKPTSEDMRVVWIQGWDMKRPLGQISEYVNQGPICSMAYSAEYASVCIVFQYAESAQNLRHSCELYEQEQNGCLFGEGCSVQLGQPYPMNDDLRRMNSPVHERRRLTFARSQMFAHGMTEARFKDDIYELVGPANVELVWLFNSGNATVVFTSTAISRVVRENFLRKSKMRGPYENLQVSYSHDPCEKPMNLITQIGAPSAKRPRSDSAKSGINNGGGLHRSNTTGRNSGGGLSRRQSRRAETKKDDDGWQTVTHKK